VLLCYVIRSAPAIRKITLASRAPAGAAARQALEAGAVAHEREIGAGVALLGLGSRHPRQLGVRVHVSQSAEDPETVVSGAAIRFVASARVPAEIPPGALVDAVARANVAVTREQ
jgi:hypothetical protein